MTTVKNDLAYIAGYLESYLEDGGDIQMQCLFDDVLALIAKPKDNQIIVDELRPMSSAFKVSSYDSACYPPILVFLKGYDFGISAMWDPLQEHWVLDGKTKLKYYDNDFSGFIPMPIYHQRNEHSG